MGKITLCRPESRADAEARFRHASSLLTRKLNLDLIAEHYDDLLLLAGSLKFGHATASLLVGKLSASGRQNALATALKEYGARRIPTTTGPRHPVLIATWRADQNKNLEDYLPFATSELTTGRSSTASVPGAAEADALEDLRGNISAGTTARALIASAHQ